MGFRLSKRAHRTLRCLQVVSILSAPSFAFAQSKEAAPKTSSLSWVRLDGAQECVSIQDLARDVEGRLGRAIFVSASQADLSLEGHIERRPGESGWKVTITVRNRSGELVGTRELVRDHGACDEMRAPIALALAVMIDPDASLSAPETKPAEVVLPPVPKASTPVPPVPAEGPLAPPSRWRFDVGASIVGALGLLPNVGAGISASGLFDPPRFLPLEGFGAIWFDNTASTEGNGRATFNVGYLGGGLCPIRHHGGRLHAYLCGAGYLGVVKSRGTGFDVSKPDEQKVFIAAGVEAKVSIRIAGPLAARAGLSTLVPLIRDSFVYRQPDGVEVSLFRMAPVVGIGEVGFGMVMP